VINRSIARRYAQALIDLVDADQTQAVSERLAAFNEFIEGNPLLKEVLSSPAFRMEERKKVLDKILQRLGWSRPLDKFLWYLVEHRRVVLLGAVVESFVAMVDERRGRVRVNVASARPLDEPTAASLKRSLTRGLEKEVIIEPRVDASLLAGLRVNIGDLVIDGSLETQLENLRQRLIRQQV